MHCLLVRRVVINMSLRGALFATKQSPTQQGDCLATARNDRLAKVNALREWWSSRANVFLAGIATQSAGGAPFRACYANELRPQYERTRMPSILDKAFKRLTVNMKVELNTIITCPQCGFARQEQMPPDT